MKHKEKNKKKDDGNQSQNKFTKGLKISDIKSLDGNVFRETLKHVLDLYYFMRDKIARSLQLEMILSFGVCLLAASIIYTSTSENLDKLDKQEYIDYGQSVKEIDILTDRIVTELEGRGLRFEEQDLIRQTVDRELIDFEDEVEYYITDSNGRIIVDHNAVLSERVMIHSVMRRATKITEADNKGGSVTRIAPFQLTDGSAYFIMEATVIGEVAYQVVGNKSGLVALGVATLVFLVFFYWMTHKKISYIIQLSEGVGNIAQGNLDFKVDELGSDELYDLSRSINYMTASLKEQMALERKSEQSKRDLITNVSHDLRTPLTSILGYLRLVKDGKCSDEAQQAEYIQTVYTKSEQLNALINDLFEYTKISYSENNMKVERISLSGLVEQSIEEFIPAFEESDLSVEKDVVLDDVYVMLDPNKTYRVIENLISNAIRYSKKPSTVRIGLQVEEGNARFWIENTGKHMGKKELEKIFDRFYRAEGSRSRETAGTGLGLAISKSIVENQKGRIWAESENGLVRFNVVFPIMN